MEDRRTQFQVKTVKQNLDKLETQTKRKNLVIEGIPELDGMKEIVEKVISEMFDQMAVNKSVNFEGCYRVGAYSKSRTRPVLVSFESQADRDLVYSKRFDLKHTKDYQKVWINEGGSSPSGSVACYD